MFLSVPSQRPLPGVETRPAAVRDWLDDLPYTNAAETAHTLIERLRDIHHQPLDAAHRHELMTLFLAAFDRLHEPLRHHGSRDPAQVSSRLHTLDRLTEELLIGCKYIINDAQAGGSRWRKPRYLNQAVAIAAQLIALLLATRYQVYLPTDDQLWREAGMLLQYSESQPGKCVLGEDVSLPFARSTTGVATSYTLMAILRLSDPYRLPHGSLWECFGFLNAQLERMILTPQSAPPEDPNATAICLTCEPTAWRTALPEQANAAEWRWLAMSPLIEALEEAARALRQQDATPADLGFSDHIRRYDCLAVLDRLHKQWTHPPERQLPRSITSDQVYVVPGLSGAFYLHNQGRGFRPEDFADWKDDSHIDLGGTGQGSPTGQRTTVENGHQALRCTLLNRGPGGMAIRLAGGSPINLRVGDIMAVSTASPESAGGDWLVAVVRWLVNPASWIEVGMQYIARNPQACAVRSPAAGERYQAALTTDIEQNARRYHVLISSKGLYGKDRLLELADGQHPPIQVRCTHLIETTGLYERFCYEPV